jgi:hypothetical protein
MMLDEISLENAPVHASAEDAIKAVLRDEIWKWLDAHANDEIWTANILFVHKTFRVRDLETVFEALFGRPV